MRRTNGSGTIDDPSAGLHSSREAGCQGELERTWLVGKGGDSSKQRVVCMRDHILSPCPAGRQQAAAAVAAGAGAAAWHTGRRRAAGLPIPNVDSTQRFAT